MIQEISYETKQKKCKTCKKWKPFDQFAPLKTVKSGLHSQCFDCKRAYQRKWMHKAWRTNPLYRTARTKWNRANREKMRAYSRKMGRKRREELLAIYGNKCACCGETQYEFLAIDHKNNDGSLDRKTSYRSGGRNAYHYIKKKGFPNTYQVLCHNCNLAKGFYGACPHQLQTFKTK